MTLLLLGALGLLILWGVSVYNAFIRMRNQASEAWSGIDVQLKRRYDLIPNLVETVKGYQKHESNIFEEVAQLRSQAMHVQDVKARGEAESALSLGLGKLFAVAEDYPELAASQNFMELQSTLSQIEDEIQLSRRYYNGTVRHYNTKIESVPSMIIARLFAFTQREYFEISDEAQKVVPHVKFD